MHLLFECESDSDRLVAYRVMSTDLNPARDWQALGRLWIKKSEKTFDFEPLNEWATQGITVSPNDPATAEELKGSGEYWMAWRGRIRAWALRMIEQNHYPKDYPS